MTRKILSLLLSLFLCLALVPSSLAYPSPFYDPETQLWGLGDFTEDAGLVQLLPPEYDSIGSFSDDGFALVQKGGLWGVVNGSGTFTIPLEYDYVVMGAEGVATVRNGESLSAYFRASDGKALTDFCFLDTNEFYQLGVNRRVVNGKEVYGAVNTRGETVIPFEYDSLYQPHPNADMQFIWARKDHLSGAFHYDGSILRRCIYPSDVAMQLSLALPERMSQEEELSALISASRTWEPVYCEENGLWAYRPTQFDVANDPGWVIPARFASAQSFDADGYAKVTYPDGRSGYIDPSGIFSLTGGKPLSFTDVPAGSWFEQGVRTCAEKGIMVGTSESLFSPEAQLTDAECLTLALRLRILLLDGVGALLKAPEDWGEVNSFDPGADKWYRDAVYTASLYAIDNAEGFSQLLDSLRRSDGKQTSRETFARALVSAAGPLEKRYTVESIPDLPSRGPETESIFSLYEAGILTGVDESGSFDPYKTLTRAEAATMVSRVLNESLRIQASPKTLSAG